MEQLQEKLDIELLELKCNVHPLDGLANCARKTLRELEKGVLQTGVSRVFGSDCKAANLIHTVSKMQYKDGKGDPAGFKTFLKKEGIPVGTILRYVGKILHVLFHMAEILYSFQDKLKEYLKHFCRGPSELRNAMFQDMEIPMILLELQVLGLFGKYITGPWMSELYGNENNKSHLEVVLLLQNCVQSINIYKDEPLKMMTSETSAFGKPLKKDSVLDALHQPVANAQEEMVLQTVLTTMAKKANIVLSRQLEAYVTGEFSNPTEKQLSETQSAPIHNMQAERTLGMTDSLIHRAPNSTMGFVDGKVRGKLNQVMHWLDSKDPASQRDILKSEPNIVREGR